MAAIILDGKKLASLSEEEIKKAPIAMIGAFLWVVFVDCCLNAKN